VLLVAAGGETQRLAARDVGDSKGSGELCVRHYSESSSSSAPRRTTLSRPPFSNLTARHTAVPFLASGCRASIRLRRATSRPCAALRAFAVITFGGAFDNLRPVFVACFPDLPTALPPLDPTCLPNAAGRCWARGPRAPAVVGPAGAVGARARYKFLGLALGALPACGFCVFERTCVRAKSICTT
jgi:hypothetical protein